MVRLLLPILLVSPLCASPSQDLRLSGMFADHMVLQRETTAPIWGWAAAGAEVSVKPSWSAEAVLAKADGEGAWRADLSTPKAGGPYTLSVTAGKTITLEDVMVGEVWICSGQSNMEWHLSWFADATATINSIDEPQLRLCTVGKAFSDTAKGDASISWGLCTPAAAADFSAVGFHFGRELAQALPDMPIGLVMTAWGGTVVEAWTSEAALRVGGEFDSALDLVAARRAGHSLVDNAKSLESSWWNELFKQDPGLAAGWNRAGGDPDGWDNVDVPTQFVNMGLGSFDGCVWFRRGFEVPPNWAGKDLVLAPGAMDDMDVTWINGIEVGSVREMGKYLTAREYAVPAATMVPGTNVLAVMVVDTGGAGTIGWTSSGPGTIELRCPELDQRVILNGTWAARPGAEAKDLEPFPRSDWFTQNTPSALSNGMIEPLIPFAMRGVIWYQGESNVGRSAQYQRLFPGMIQDWRHRWGQADFPFYWVQIAPFGYAEDTGQAARLREAQSMTLSLPHTGQAVIMDIGNPTDIHPGDKDKVGRRLALLALAKDYGKDLVWSGPTLSSSVFKDSQAQLTFDHADGLELRGSTGHKFVIAGEDRVFHPAQARVEGGTVIVSSASVPSPMAVRFAWGAADASSLFNAAGLCASSFRTDQWDD